MQCIAEKRNLGSGLDVQLKIISNAFSAFDISDGVYVCSLRLLPRLLRMVFGGVRYFFDIGGYMAVFERYGLHRSFDMALDNKHSSHSGGVASALHKRRNRSQSRKNKSKRSYRSNQKQITAKSRYSRQAREYRIGNDRFARIS